MNHISKRLATAIEIWVEKGNRHLLTAERDDRTALEALTQADSGVYLRQTGAVGFELPQAHGLSIERRGNVDFGEWYGSIFDGRTGTLLESVAATAETKYSSLDFLGKYSQLQWLAKRSLATQSRSLTCCSPYRPGKHLDLDNGSKNTLAQSMRKGSRREDPCRLS